jgi:Putative glutamine amidotransferase
MNTEYETAWPLYVGVLVAVVLVVGLVWSYRGLRGKATRRRQRTFLSLRIAAALVLVFLALEPVMRTDRLKTENTRVVVLLDTSSSMDTKDSYKNWSRYEAGTDLLFGEDGITEVIRSEIPVFVMGFDTGSVRAEPSELLNGKPRGHLTDLAGALRSVAERDSRTAAVVLVSDGAHNADGDVREAAASVPAPIFAVGLGRPVGMRQGVKDLAITAVDAPETALVNNAVLAEVAVRSTGYDLTKGSDRMVDVILSQNDQVLQSREVELTEDGLAVRVEMKVVPEREGAFTYKVEVRARGDEENKENNVRTFTVRAVDRQIAVLYVEGAARWEYKWIKTVLQKDPAIRFTGVVATGRGAYLVQGEKTTNDLAKGLPQSAEGYEPLNIVILGDIAASSFDAKTIEELRAFVDRGGGLLVLGGYQAFGAGGWGSTPLADLLPVVIEDDDTTQFEKPFAPAVSPEGRVHPILTGLTDAFETEPRPILDGCSPLGRTKPGATVLLENPEDANAPVLAVGRFGAGRVAAFAGDTTYRWALAGRGGEGSGLHERFFGQLVRGLFSPEEAIEQTGKPVVIETDGHVCRLYEEVRVMARVRGEKGEYIDDAVISCTAIGPGKASIDLVFTRIERQNGHYEARFRPNRPGDWRVTGKATRDGVEIGWGGDRIEVSSRTIESEETGIRDDILRDIAAASGGRYYPLPASRRIPTDILATLRDEMVREETRVWDPRKPFLALLFLVFVGLLGAEWVLRKRSHLL